MTAQTDHGSSPTRTRIAICGGGVAALEALVAVRATLGMAPRVDLIAPGPEFVYQPLTVAEPFGLAQALRLDLADITREHGAQLHLATLEAVVAGQHRIELSRGVRLFYDSLIVAVGARRRAWLDGALHFSGAAEVPAFRQVLDSIESGEVARLAVVVPPGLAWTLPAYELALLTASWIAERHITAVDLAVVTAESEPLSAFGPSASRGMRNVLHDRGIRLHAAAEVTATDSSALLLADGDTVAADQVVALPRLDGPRLTGLPADDQGFVEIDGHARVAGLDDVYAAGDATSFPIKQGGIATQLADLAVESIAARRYGAKEPPEFAPVLRGMLFTGVAPTYLRAAVGGGSELGTHVAGSPLWWPPTKVAGRHLGPYISRVRQRDVDPESEAAGAIRRPEVQAGQHQARELALSFALSDANVEDYRSALRWLELVELLDGALPPEYERKRAAWLRGRPAPGSADR
jgi:sulfide:quinone oxidoreductase